MSVYRVKVKAPDGLYEDLLLIQGDSCAAVEAKALKKAHAEAEKGQHPRVVAIELIGELS